MKKHFFSFLFLLFFVVSVAAQTGEPQKVDEFENLWCDEYLARMDAVIITAVNNPSSTVYVLIYEGRERQYNTRKKKTELMLPTFGSAEAKIRSIKKYLSIRKFKGKNFTFVKGGFRESWAVEIWLVPAGGMPPKATPTVTKMKYRKGKAIGFCTECCGV